MAMTEKQGGSDLRATMTTARPATARAGSGEAYLLTGHKWFFSVPMSDVFLTLAQTDQGLSCFLATGWLPDGSRNRLKIQRLKDKCGNRSNASSEVEFHGLHAVMLGEEGHGIRTIVEMAHLTRLDFAIGSAGLMRQALSQAIHHDSQPARIPAPAGRSADHAQRRGGPRGRGRGADVDGPPARSCPRPLRGERGRTAAVPDRDAGRQVLGLQARARRSWSRHWNATAATASSRIT